MPSPHFLIAKCAGSILRDRQVARGGAVADAGELSAERERKVQ